MHDIEIKNVTKRYNDHLAVDNISLSIPSGQIFGLLGPNGAGKSTLISMLCGIVPMDQGDISVNGFSIQKSPKEVKEYIGYVPQDLALFEDLSVLDNLKFFGRMYGLSSQTLKKAVSDALELSALSEKQKHKVSSLSGGMKRRLNIACAILHQPRILIMDEPTVGIDPQSRNHILEFTKLLNQEKASTIIYTSHYMEEVDALCDHLSILDLGKVLTYGSKESIYRQYAQSETLAIQCENFSESAASALKSLAPVESLTFEKGLLKLSLANHYALSEILEVLQQAQSDVLHLTVEKPNLEHIFLSLTGKSLRE